MRAMYGPGRERDQEDHGQARLDHAVDAAFDRAGGADAESEQQHGNRQHDVDRAREQRVDPAAEEAGEHAPPSTPISVEIAVPMMPTSSDTRVP